MQLQTLCWKSNKILFALSQLQLIESFSIFFHFNEPIFYLFSSFEELDENQPRSDLNKCTRKFSTKVLLIKSRNENDLIVRKKKNKTLKIQIDQNSRNGLRFLLLWELNFTHHK